MFKRYRYAIVGAVLIGVVGCGYAVHEVVIDKIKSAVVGSAARAAAESLGVSPADLARACAAIGAE